MNPSILGLMLALLQGAPQDTLVVPLEEVVVTGTRIPESVLRVPAAISVVERRTLELSRGLGLKDALEMIPGVLVQSRAGAPDVRVTIRGFGARGNGERSNAGNMRGIRILTDGIPLTEPDGRTSLDLVDLGIADRVEVSRSNSSSLYGNASGGVVHLRTDLGFASRYLEVRERAGSFGYHREQASSGFMVGPGRGVASLINTTFDGWREHSSSSATLAQARMRLPLDTATQLGIVLDAAHTINRFPGALTQANFDANPQMADSDFVARDERRDHWVGRVALSLDRSFGTSQEASLAVYVEPKVLHRSERNRFRDFTRYHLGTTGTYQVRWRPSDAVSAVTLIGADEAYQDGAILFYTLQNGGRGDQTVSDKREAANSAGFFGQQTLGWQRWSVGLGGRYDNLRYASEDHANPTLNARKNFMRFTPKGSLSYALEHHTAYVALGGGVEAPAFNEIDPPAPFDTVTSLNPFLEPMHSVTYEAGLKGQLLEGSALGRAGYEVAAYQIEVRNEIVPFGGGAFFRTAGRSRRRGLELGLDWRPVERLRAQGSVAATRSEYVEYAPDNVDLSGNKVPGLPDVNVAGSLHLDVWRGAWVEVNSEHVGSYFANDNNTAGTEAYTLIGASVGAERVGDRLTTRAFVSGYNLTDEHHAASVFINGIHGEYFEPGLPRSWAAGLTVHWR